ncbi:MAG: hypothetical protein MUE39_10060 [Gammaproteobacteria bacterium]|jgi:hypothetical protein|nr:hypothetical protein [Gammaproteobacteria bacterium]MCU0971360.1 hypothetical protein [Gammaproteobacteria bacterium]
MTFRITSEPKTTTDGDGVLRLAGRLGAAEVPVLEESASLGVRALDLSELLWSDEEGVAALRRLRGRGIELRNASVYLGIRLG